MEKKSLRIGLDMDGCIMNIDKLVWCGMPQYLSRMNVPYQRSKQISYDLSKTFRIDKALSQAFWASEEAAKYYFDLEPVSGVRELIDVAHKHGDEVLLVTARSTNNSPFCQSIMAKYGMSLEKYTVNYLESHQIKLDRYLFGCGNKCSTIINEGIDIIWEDAPENITEIRRNTDCQCYAMDTSFNRKIKDSKKVKRVYSPYDLANQIYPENCAGGYNGKAI